MGRITHGMSGTPIHAVWRQIKQRCYNPRCKGYPNYGGRGITVCPQWHDFVAFYNDVSQLPHYGEPGYTIDRINNDGNYEPGNVRWATRTEQNRNKRDNHFVEINGEKMIVQDAAKLAGVTHATIQERIQRGWTGEELLKPPQNRLTNEQARYVRENPDNLTQEELAEMFGLTPSAISLIQTGKTYPDAGGTIRTEHGKRKLNTEQRNEIRRLYATGNYTYKQLADMFGCTQAAISYIVHETD